KAQSLESLEAKFACQKCPCHWPRRCSQIIQFVIRFETPPQRTACPVAKKAIFENRESDQLVARLDNANFGLKLEVDNPAARDSAMGNRASPARAAKSRMEHSAPLPIDSLVHPNGEP